MEAEAGRAERLGQGQEELRMREICVAMMSQYRSEWVVGVMSYGMLDSSDDREAVAGDYGTVAAAAFATGPEPMLTVVVQTHDKISI